MSAYSTARKRRRDREAERAEERRQTADILRAFLEDADRRVYTVVRAVPDSGDVHIIAPYAIDTSDGSPFDLTVLCTRLGLGTYGLPKSSTRGGLKVPGSGYDKRADLVERLSAELYGDPHELTHYSM